MRAAGVDPSQPHKLCIELGATPRLRNHFMTRMKCVIHLCTYSLEAPEDATTQMKRDCGWMQCPLCVRDEFTALRDKVGKLTYDRDAILRCIKVVQENMTMVDHTKP